MAEDTYAAGETVVKCDSIKGNVEEALQEFVDEHPTFAEQFDVDTDPGEGEGAIRAPGLADGVPTGGEVEDGAEEFEVNSEWGFAAAYGYSVAMGDVLAFLGEENLE